MEKHAVGCNVQAKQGGKWFRQGVVQQFREGEAWMMEA
jgi:hypothetical protein